jgi:hypothetical protein
LEVLEASSSSCQSKPPLKKTVDEYKHKVKKGVQAKHPLNSALKRRFDHEVIAMLITTNTPFDFLKTEGFRRFMECIAP